MAYFNFQNLIQKYNCDFTLITKAEGSYNDMGDYVEGAAGEMTKQGAIVGFPESKIYREEGTLTTQDKHLYMTEPIENALTDAEVCYNGNKYSIEEEKGKDNAKFTGVYTYILRRVSAFD